MPGCSGNRTEEADRQTFFFPRSVRGRSQVLPRALESRSTGIKEHRQGGPPLTQAAVSFEPGPRLRARPSPLPPEKPRRNSPSRGMQGRSKRCELAFSLTPGGAQSASNSVLWAFSVSFSEGLGCVSEEHSWNKHWVLKIQAHTSAKDMT